MKALGLIAGLVALLAVPPTAQAATLHAQGNEVTTPGGYKVRLEGDTAYVTAPNGKQIKVWGDPHVEHSDGKGGKQNIDFRKATTSFMLPDGTKITMKAYGPGATLGAKGRLGIVTVRKGSRIVRLSNGRATTGKLGTVTLTWVKTALTRASAQDDGDVLHVVGDGAQLAYRGKVLGHEEPSSKALAGPWPILNAGLAR